MLEQNVRLFDIYNGYFDEAAKQFDDKQFAEAFTNFKNAYSVEEYIASKEFEYNGFRFSAFDTTLVTNIALSAYMAKKEDDAAFYYKKIADQKINGAEYQTAYQFLVEYYNRKKNKSDHDKYLQMGREFYPDADYWYLAELGDADENDKKALLAKYEDLGKKYPDRYTLHYNYAVELFNYTYTGNSKPAEYKELQKKIESEIKKTLSLKKDYPEANVLMSRHLYNIIYDLQDEKNAIKGNTLADENKRSELKTKMISKSDELILYAKPAYDGYNAKATLNPSEKKNFKSVAEFLSSAHLLKGDKEKAEEYKKKLTTIGD
jgi:hypothetical protein